MKISLLEFGMPNVNLELICLVWEEPLHVRSANPNTKLHDRPFHGEGRWVYSYCTIAIAAAESEVV